MRSTGAVLIAARWGTSLPIAPRLLETKPVTIAGKMVTLQKSVPALGTPSRVVMDAGGQLLGAGTLHVVWNGIPHNEANGDISRLRCPETTRRYDPNQFKIRSFVGALIASASGCEAEG